MPTIPPHARMTCSTAPALRTDETPLNAHGTMTMSAGFAVETLAAEGRLLLISRSRLSRQQIGGCRGRCLNTVGLIETCARAEITTDRDDFGGSLD